MYLFSYITSDELEEALAKHNMGDVESIKSIIAEVDTDHVSLASIIISGDVYLMELF